MKVSSLSAEAAVSESSGCKAMGAIIYLEEISTERCFDVFNEVLDIPAAELHTKGE